MKSVSRQEDCAKPGRPSRTVAEMAERDAESREAVPVAQRLGKADPDEIGFVRRAMHRLVEKEGGWVLAGHLL